MPLTQHQQPQPQRHQKDPGLDAVAQQFRGDTPAPVGLQATIPS